MCISLLYHETYSHWDIFFGDKNKFKKKYFLSTSTMSVAKLRGKNGSENPTCTRIWFNRDIQYNIEKYIDKNAELWQIGQTSLILLCRQSALRRSLHFSWHFTPHSVQRTPCRAIPQSKPIEKKYLIIYSNLRIFSNLPSHS